MARQLPASRRLPAKDSQAVGKVRQTVGEPAVGEPTVVHGERIEALKGLRPRFDSGLAFFVARAPAPQRTLSDQRISLYIARTYGK